MHSDPHVDAFYRSGPYVYAYDGSDWHYETSVGGASLVGRAVHLRPGKGKKVRFAPIWVRLDAGAVLADRSVQAEILAAEDETVYVDHAQLAAVHHPRGHEVVSSSSLQWSTLGEKDPRQLWAFPTAECRTPTRASWCGELDVREALSERTDMPAAYELARENVYELEFGPVHDARRAWLLVDGWKVKHPRGLPPQLCGRKPTLEIRQPDGSYLPVKTLATPRGDRKTIAVDLSALSWPTGSYQLRLSTGTHEGGHTVWFLDRVRLVEATPAPLSVSQVIISHAELSFRGAPTLLWPEQHDRPRLSRNDGGGKLGPGTYGAFTRHGDVTPLLRDADDRVVVMRQGDVVSLRFDHVPAPPPGFETTLFLRTNLVYKPRIAAGAAGPTKLTAHVGPMPRHHMGRYELGVEEREDAVYREYLARWNTRRVSPAGERAA